MKFKNEWLIRIVEKYWVDRKGISKDDFRCALKESWDLSKKYNSRCSHCESVALSLYES